MKKIRFRYSRGEELKYISHLDMMRLWPRVFRRAGLDMAYSEGFNAHPRLAVAAPLAVGWTSETELMEAWLENPPAASTVLGLVAARMPAGVTVEQAMFMPQESPSLQSLVRFAEYQVTLPLDRPAAQIGQAVDNLLELTTLEWSHQRDKTTRTYDLRAQIDDMYVVGTQDDAVTLFMRLKNDPSGSGRPEQMALALGFTAKPRSIHRTRLVLA
ncbi:MAG: TIGR03936 family radical SAM-associated protein [Dehalogenimonas sp.]|jgi:radical SAM-linked protein|uniref:TIGR03936 family radical SAM-associated protein n=1 Tax=Candidatus Dehalogenimonas loeffleri TaxID=3127115 RepID=A0ABZ2J8N9_9CHLR|nr:TIGR03936 family radical SAM-associated protein [Dehalogenimonas sp.]